MPKRLHNRDILAPDVVANSTNSKRSDIQEHSFHGMQSLLCRPLSKCYPCPETSVTHVPRLYTKGESIRLAIQLAQGPQRLAVGFDFSCGSTIGPTVVILRVLPKCQD